MNRYLVSAALIGVCTLAGCHNRDRDSTEPGMHPAPSATAPAPTMPPPAATSPTPASTSAQPASASTR